MSGLRGVSDLTGCLVRGRMGVWSGGVWSEGEGGGGRPPPPEMATAAVGRHPTGMHSCFRNSFCLKV